MTLQIELDPEIEARLTSEARSEGVAVEEYAERVLRNSVATYPVGYRKLTPEGFKRLSREMSKFSDRIPVLPPEATERESFYEDRW